ncbi:MAG: hypothetical protein ACRCTE_10180 [Cellulosilyticaceae bacterium]
MIKVKSRIYGIMILLLVVTCGCSQRKEEVVTPFFNSESSAIAVGRLVENNVEVKGLDDTKTYLSKIVITSNQELRLYLWDDELLMYTQDANGAWQQEGLEWGERFKEMCTGWIEDIAMDEEDNLYIMYAEMDEENNIQTFIAKVQDNQVGKIDVMWKSKESYIKADEMEILANGNLLISTFGNLEEYSLKTGEFVETYEEMASSIATVNDQLYALNSEEQIINVFNTENHLLERTISCEGVDEGSQITLDNEGGIYLVSEGGIQYMNQEGSIWQLLVEGNLTSLNMPSYYFDSIAVLNQEIYILFYQKEGGNVFKKYVYDEDIPTIPSIEVTAYTLKENNMLREAASQLQLMNPDVRVTIEVGLEDGGAVTRTDAIKTLNTKILTQQGPDIIVLDGLNAQDYIEKGALEDLSVLSQEILNEDHYLSNITGAYKVDDQIYAVPTRFSIPILGGDENVLNQLTSIEDMKTYRKMYPDSQLLSYKTPEELIYKFYTVCAPSWMNEKHEFQEEKLQSFLEAIKSLAYEGEPRSIEFPQTKEYFMMGGFNELDAVDVAHKQISIQPILPLTIYDFLVNASANELRGNGNFIALPGQVEGVFEPYCTLAINSRSEQKELAQQMIQIALSEDVQNKDTGCGYPVNKTAFQNWINGSSFNQEASYTMGNGSGQKLSVQWGYESELASFYDMCQGVIVPSHLDEDLLDIVLEGSRGYFEGTISIDETMKNIKQRVTIYLAE